jgi:hypothetical protein
VPRILGRGTPSSENGGAKVAVCRWWRESTLGNLCERRSGHLTGSWYQALTAPSMVHNVGLGQAKLFLSYVQSKVTNAFTIDRCVRHSPLVDSRPWTRYTAPSKNLAAIVVRHLSRSGRRCAAKLPTKNSFASECSRSTVYLPTEESSSAGQFTSVLPRGLYENAASSLAE